MPEPARRSTPPSVPPPDNPPPCYPAQNRSRPLRGLPRSQGDVPISCSIHVPDRAPQQPLREDLIIHNCLSRSARPNAANLSRKTSNPDLEKNSLIVSPELVTRS